MTTMKKVIVIGCPGGGKSVFSRTLHEITGLPLYPLDRIGWRADRTMLPQEEIVRQIRKIGATDAWIMDGNYGASMDLRMSLCDTIIFLDYPTDVCLKGALARRGTVRPDLPWVEPSDETNEDFLDFIRNYKTVNRPVVLERIGRHPDKTAIILKSREEGDAFLNSLRS